MSARWSVLRTTLAQLGLLAALRLYALKLLRRVLMPGAQLHFGNSAEDVLILYLAENYLGTRRFTYVDVGCHEPRRISNSYLAYLAGSSGLAIDLNPAFEQAFRRERPHDVFVCAALSDTEADMTVHEYTVPEVATIDAEQAARWSPIFGATGSRQVRTARLETVVAQHLAGRQVDVLMMDVEGHELAVLRGANLPALAPGLVVCEIHARTLAQVQGHAVAQFLAEQRYVLVAHAANSAYFARADLVEKAGP